MKDIKIFSISGKQAEKAAPLLRPEVAEALKKGLPVTAFVAVDGERAVGAVAGIIDGEVFEISSLFIEKDFRRQGVGSALVKKLEELLDESDMMIRARYTVHNEDNETLNPFFKRQGFTENPLSYPKFYMGDLGDVKIDNRFAPKKSLGIFSFTEVQESLLRSFSNTALEEGYPVPEGGLVSKKVEKDLSFAVVKDNKIGAYATIEKVDEKMLEVTSLWSDLDDPMELLHMLSKLIHSLKESYGPDTRIAMLALNPKSLKLIDYLFNYVRPCSYRFVKM